MEAEADLVNFGEKQTLEAEFENLVVDEDIENELAMLKSSVKKQEQG
jgi:phage shock protein A